MSRIHLRKPMPPISKQKVYAKKTTTHGFSSSNRNDIRAILSDYHTIATPIYVGGDGLYSNSKGVNILQSFIGKDAYIEPLYFDLSMNDLEDDDSYMGLPSSDDDDDDDDDDIHHWEFAKQKQQKRTISSESSSDAILELLESSSDDDDDVDDHEWMAVNRCF